MTHDKVGSVAAVVLFDDPMPMHESLKAHGEFLDVTVHLVEACYVLGELELVDTDGYDGGSECSECEGLHIELTRMKFINN